MYISCKWSIFIFLIISSLVVYFTYLIANKVSIIGQKSKINERADALLEIKCSCI